jgi:WD40 repeat protein
MRVASVSLAAGILLLAAPAMAQAQNVSFSKEIVPIFKDNCAKCHNTRQPAGGFSLSSFAELEKGGKSGKVLAPKHAEARLVKLIDGPKPAMPPGGKLKPEEIAKIKAWIDQGSKPDVDPKQVVIQDTKIPVVQVPKIPLRVPVLPQVAALAWSADNSVLAIGTYKTILFVNPANGQTIKKLEGHADVVHSLQFSPDGKYLAAAGGLPSQIGEIKIWEFPSGKEVRTINGHKDFIYSCSWSPDSKNIASASYDKEIKIWDVSNGNEVKTLKDHADAVYAVAYNPQGNLIASGSADRSVKVWDVASGKRIYTLSGHGDIVFSLAWNKAGNQITSVGADRTVRTWNVNAQAGNQARNITAHQKAVQEVVYSADGSMVATVSDDKTAKIWNSANGAAKATISDLPDALLSAAFSPDNQKLAIGSFDGSVRIYNTADGKLAATVIDTPKAPAPKTAPAPAAPTPAKTQ